MYSSSLCQSSFWSYIDAPFLQVIEKLGIPNSFEYQNDGTYWIAYNYGHRNIVYVIDKGMVNSILYLEQIESYDSAKKIFIRWHDLSENDGFITQKKDIGFLYKLKDNIKFQAKLVEDFNYFIVAIEIRRL